MMTVMTLKGTSHDIKKVRVCLKFILFYERLMTDERQRPDRQSLLGLLKDVQL